MRARSNDVPMVIVEVDNGRTWVLMGPGMDEWTAGGVRIVLFGAATKHVARWFHYGAFRRRLLDTVSINGRCVY